MAGTGSFGLIKLGASGAEVTLPEMTTYREDPVIQGGDHVLLNGKVMSDEFGNRLHFFLGWKGLSEAEYAVIQSAWTATPPLYLITHEATYKVARGNHGPKEFTEVGWISTSIELDETP